MHHVVTLSRGNVIGRPYRGQCSCGTAGDFGGRYDAEMYFAGHFAGLSGISTGEFKVSDEIAQEIHALDNPPAPEPTPEPEPAPAPEPPQARKRNRDS